MKDISEAVTQDKLEVPYNPHMLVTYKAIAGTYAEPESPTYLTDKVTDIEWALHNMRADKDAYYKLRSKISGGLRVARENVDNAKAGQARARAARIAKEKGEI